MDWSLHRCGRRGHVTYAPDEADLREYVSASTGSGELWQCLRCGTYVAGEPQASGPAADAPTVRRDREIRGDFILKLFAIERAFRVLLFGAVAYGIWKFASARLTIAQAFNKELPIVRTLFSQLGFTISNSLLDRLHKVLHISTMNLHLIALGIAGLAVVSGIEAFALWQAKRWGEYFAMIVTSLGLPVEAYELYKAITVTKSLLLALNLLLVVYLVVSRRLFGVRGGRRAYEARLRSESVIDAAASAAAARAAAGPPTPQQAGQQTGHPSGSAPWPPAPNPWPPAASPWPPGSQESAARGSGSGGWPRTSETVIRPTGVSSWPPTGQDASRDAGAGYWPPAEPEAADLASSQLPGTRAWPEAPGRRADAVAPWPPADPPPPSVPPVRPSSWWSGLRRAETTVNRGTPPDQGQQAPEDRAAWEPQPPQAPPAQ